MRWPIRAKLCGLFAGIVVSELLACGASTGTRVESGLLSGPVAEDIEEGPVSVRPAPGVQWPRYTSSPGTRRTVAGVPGCQSEARLRDVALKMAHRQANGSPPKDLSETLFLLRSAGVPHVWPRIWSVEGPSSAMAEMRQRLKNWLSSLPVTGQLRCGTATVELPPRAGAESRGVLVGLAVDVVAELSAFPTRARVGQWLSLRARGLVESRDARVVLLGPKGYPRSLRAGGRAGDYRASFSLNEPGLWRIQVTARQESGPPPYRPPPPYWLGEG